MEATVCIPVYVYGWGGGGEAGLAYDNGPY